MIETAFLSNKNNYTNFSYNNTVIRFLTSDKLEYYTDIIQWDNGYIVANAKYKNSPLTEEYIDLVPILENLYINPEEFCKPIKKVEIRYD